VLEDLPHRHMEAVLVVLVVLVGLLHTEEEGTGMGLLVDEKGIEEVVDDTAVAMVIGIVNEADHAVLNDDTPAVEGATKSNVQKGSP